MKNKNNQLKSNPYKTKKRQKGEENKIKPAKTTTKLKPKGQHTPYKN